MLINWYFSKRGKDDIDSTYKIFDERCLLFAQWAQQID
jgi:hypothetical protein